ncbi:MAG: Lsr2 dimerization domain-containing protein [Frankiaceae bacterium]
MSRQLQTLVTDDLDGSDAAGTVRFGYEGVEYEIDLPRRRARPDLSRGPHQVCRVGACLARSPACSVTTTRARRSDHQSRPQRIVVAVSARRAGSSTPQWRPRQPARKARRPPP